MSSRPALTGRTVCPLMTESLQAQRGFTCTNRFRHQSRPPDTHASSFPSQQPRPMPGSLLPLQRAAPPSPSSPTVSGQLGASVRHAHFSRCACVRRRRLFAPPLSRSSVTIRSRFPRVKGISMPIETATNQCLTGNTDWPGPPRRHTPVADSATLCPVSHWVVSTEPADATPLATAHNLGYR